MNSPEKHSPETNRPQPGSVNKLVSIHIPRDRNWLLPVIPGEKKEPAHKLDPGNPIAKFTTHIYSESLVLQATKNFAEYHSVYEKDGIHYARPKDIIEAYQANRGELWEAIYSHDAGLEDIATIIIQMKALGMILERRHIPRRPDLHYKTELRALEVGIFNSYRQLTTNLLKSAYTVEHPIEGDYSSYHEAVDEDVLDELGRLTEMANELGSLRTQDPTDFPMPDTW